MGLNSYTDKTTLNRAAENAARFFSFDDESARLADESGRSARRAAALRLVKGAKSPTDRFPGLTGAFFNRPAPRRKPESVELQAESPNYAENLKTPGTWAVVEKRPWAGEWRLRMETRPGCTVETPDQAGDRITAMLSERGARKISESCYFMACQRGGYSTFATLTLTPEARDKLKHRTLQPVGAMADGWHLPAAPEAARARQCPMGPLFDSENQIAGQAAGATVGGPFAPLHQETMRPYTPLRMGWAWSIQKEAGRFFEAANKMYQRGWQYRTWYTRHPQRSAAYANSGAIPEYGAYTPISHTPETHRIKGSRALYCASPETVNLNEAGEPYTPIRYYKTRPQCPRRAYRILKERHNGKLAYTPLKWWREPLQYLWVAEAPNMAEKCWKPEHARPVADENGELLTNPHLHLMMRWRVDYQHFRAWAKRLEKLWGHGFAHLEKIKDPQKAGSYVAKAAGYLSKAQGKSDQGEIRGNRYGISARARAPGWIESERYQVGMMGWLMAEAHEAWQRAHGEKIARREYLKKKLSGGEIRTKAGKIVKLLEEKRPEKRKAIGQKLEAVRKEIEPLPRYSKYAALFKTEDQKERFFQWAKRHGWQPEQQCSQWLHQWRREQWRRRNGSRLIAGGQDWAAWFAMADAGAVACNNAEIEAVNLWA